MKGGYVTENGERIGLKNGGGGEQNTAMEIADNFLWIIYAAVKGGGGGQFKKGGRNPFPSHVWCRLFSL